MVKDSNQYLGVISNFLGELNLADVTPSDADIFVTGADLADSASHLPELIVLDSLLDRDELKNKIKEKLGL